MNKIRLCLCRDGYYRLFGGEQNEVERLLDVLKLTANNLRSLGPAGAIKQYVVWLKTVEDAIEGAIGKAEAKND